MNILKRKISTHGVVIGLIVAAGFLLRFRQYFYNRSLWVDEAALALNLIQRPWWQLFQLLDHYQGAPAGFLLIEKIFISIFGNSEYILRLFPLISGLLAILLFFKASRFLLDRNARIFAMALMSFSSILIYYSSECKQYSSDVFLASLFLSIFLPSRSSPMKTVRLLVLGFLLAASIWFSHPLVFVLSGAGVVAIGRCIREKKWVMLTDYVYFFLLALISFAVMYFVSVRSLTMMRPFVGWSGGFLPSFSFSVRYMQSVIQWFYQSDNLGYLIDVRPLWVSMILLAVGGYSMLRQRSREFLILLLPAIFVFVVSIFGKYPFRGRMLLFLLPSILIMLSNGFSVLLRPIANKKVKSVLTALCMCFFLFVPLARAAMYCAYPRELDSLKPVLSYIHSHRYNQGTIYVSCHTLYAYRYYAPRYGLKKNKYLVMPCSATREEFKNDMNRLIRKRKVWVVATGISGERERRREQFYLRYLDWKGVRLDSFKFNDASAYLYDLGRPQSIVTKYVPSKKSPARKQEGYTRRATRALDFIERLTGARCVRCLIVADRVFNALRAYIYS